MGLTWNSWYNPLDNVATTARSIANIPGSLINGAAGGNYAPVSYGTTAPKTSTQTGAISDQNSDPRHVLDDSTTKGNMSGSTLSAQQLQTNNQVNSALARLTGQFDVGNANIDTGYNQAINSLNNTKAQNQQSYGQNQNQISQDYVTAKNSIGSASGNTLNNLLRLLGAHGAGGSSAALFSAPQAVAQNAAQQRSGANQTFGKNSQANDTSWNNYLTGYNNSVGDLGVQRQNNRNSLQAQMDITRANLIGQLSSPDLNQINGLLSQADQLGLQVPNYNVQAANYQAPSLDSYLQGQTATGNVANPSALTDSVNPYLSLLLNGKDKNQQLSF